MRTEQFQMVCAYIHCAFAQNVLNFSVWYLRHHPFSFKHHQYIQFHLVRNHLKSYNSRIFSILSMEFFDNFFLVVPSAHMKTHRHKAFRSTHNIHARSVKILFQFVLAASWVQSLFCATESFHVKFNFVLK